jgi:hypothetical protein
MPLQASLQRIEPSLLGKVPLSYFLGTLGMPGMTVRLNATVCMLSMWSAGWNCMLHWQVVAARCGQDQTLIRCLLHLCLSTACDPFNTSLASVHSVSKASVLLLLLLLLLLMLLLLAGIHWPEEDCRAQGGRGKHHAVFG